MELAYNGKDYHGWQVQPNAITVQEVLEIALTTLLRKPTAMVGCGRTDAGVHARQFFAHFDFEGKFDTIAMIGKLNSFLPKDIAVYDLFLVNEDAHARFDATGRTYKYYISQQKNPFAIDASYLVKNQLDIEKLNSASRLLFDYTDFKCFSRSNTDVKTYNCKIMKAEWEHKENMLIFTIQADRFLRNMVRAIVGTLLPVGFGKMSLEKLKEIIESRDRSEAGPSVPGHALYLTGVSYPESIKVI